MQIVLEGTLSVTLIIVVSDSGNCTISPWDMFSGTKKIISLVAFSFSVQTTGRKNISTYLIEHNPSAIYQGLHVQNVMC